MSVEDRSSPGSPGDGLVLVPMLASAPACPPPPLQIHNRAGVRAGVPTSTLSSVDHHPGHRAAICPSLQHRW